MHILKLSISISIAHWVCSIFIKNVNAELKTLKVYFYDYHLSFSAVCMDVDIHLQAFSFFVLLDSFNKILSFFLILSIFAQVNSNS